MRFSLTTVAALALLGAESLFLGVSATPLGPARNNDSVSVSGPALIEKGVLLCEDVSLHNIEPLSRLVPAGSLPDY